MNGSDDNYKVNVFVIATQRKKYNMSRCLKVQNSFLLTGGNTALSFVI